MENLHKGHRKRVKEKFRKSGLSVFEEHEVLELILFYAVPQRDTNELAHKLIKKFGSVRNVLEVPYELLMQEDGIGESIALFLNLFPAVWRYCQSKIKTKLNLCDRNGFIETMISKFEGKQTEELYVLCLDAKFDVIAMDALFKGQSGMVKVSWERLVRYVIINNVSNIALVHNHPNGVLLPSSNDVFFTKELISILKPLNVKIEDHIIISGTQYISMREMELLDDTE